MDQIGSSPLAQGGSPFGQGTVRPGQANLNPNGPKRRSESEYQTRYHDGEPGYPSYNDDFDFCAQPSVASTYSRTEGPWTIYSATDSRQPRSSITSAPMVGNLTGALTDEDVSSVISEQHGNRSFISGGYDRVPGNHNSLTFGLDAPIFHQKTELLGSASCTRNSSDKPQVHKGPRPRIKKYPCQQCDKVLNCNSDLVKHTRLHDKPFRCTISNCERTEGFITQNDLDRHKKSKHFNGVCGKTRSFQCVGKGCKRPKKIWPRLDNFRSHIAKMHTGENVDDVVKRSEIPPHVARSDIAQVSSSIDPSAMSIAPPRVIISADRNQSSVNSSSPQDQTLLSPTSATTNRQQQMSTSQPPEVLQPGNIPSAGLDMLSAAAVMSTPASSANIQHNPGLQASVMAHNVTQSDPISTLQVAVNAFLSIIQQGQMPQPAQNPSIPNIHPSVNSNPTQPPIIPASLSTSQPADQKAMFINTLEAMISTLKQEKPSTPQDIPSSPNNTHRGAEAGQECETCGKHLKRNCDMNKHMKRHTKPYGCTFAGCDKVFGSKNDWKRHENSQHFQGEFFKCQQACAGAKFDKCAFMTQHEFDMHKHLVDEHILSTDAAKGQVTVSHVGRNHQNRFWCGFCGEVLRLQNNGVAAWDERFNHIDKHFMKDHRRVEQWVDPETYKTKREMQTDEEERKRKRNTDAALNGLGTHVGLVNPLKRAGSPLLRDDEPAKQQRMMGIGENILITCCNCDAGSLLATAPSRCTLCSHKWCPQCHKETTK